MVLKKKPLKTVIRNKRRALKFAGLYERDASNDPFDQFDRWLNQALKSEPFEANAMTLATSSASGQVTARTVLLKDYDSSGFVFYTNKNSRKGRNLRLNPQASLVFYWGSLSRQVLIDGVMEEINRDKVVDYFQSRPRRSQIAAYVSQQSQSVANRSELEKKMDEIEKKFKGRQIPCPEYWCGYRLKPLRIEFWQGRPDRLHDRLCYTPRKSGVWKRERLAP
jgi:pyridoxamine 5'-phosphate oxidase